MDALTAARTEYETAKRAWTDARAAMVDSTQQGGTWMHDPAQLRIVDRLHKAYNQAGQAYRKAQSDAGITQA